MAEYYEGIGRRKTSSARVRLHVGGTGGIVVNDKPANVYFGREIDADVTEMPRFKRVAGHGDLVLRIAEQEPVLRFRANH